jgi:serine/threonine protein kinase
MSLTPGSKLGIYEVVAPLGAGGMGEVYRARDTKLGRDVAIKALPPQFAQDPTASHAWSAKPLPASPHPHIAGTFARRHRGNRYLIRIVEETPAASGTDADVDERFSSPADCIRAGERTRKPRPRPNPVRDHACATKVWTSACQGRISRTHPTRTSHSPTLTPSTLARESSRGRQRT